MAVVVEPNSSSPCSKIDPHVDFRSVELTTALIEWNALHTSDRPGSREWLLSQCPSVGPVEYKRDLAVATFHQSGAW